MVSLLRFRQDYRDRLPGWYSGWLHLGLTTLVTLGGACALAGRAGELSPWSWALVPLTFLLANLVEYLGHRYPMHQRLPLLGPMFDRHVGVHHRYFREEGMSGVDHVDFHATLIHPVQLAFFIGAVGLPGWLALELLAGSGASSLYGCTALVYLAVFEWLHLAYHAPAASRVARLPVVARLRHHHLVHHEAPHMQTANFNISFPILDTLLGTTAEEGS
jgi:hypothetical protein